MSTTDVTTPLSGIRVIELTHAIAGPQCGQILADHGAEVVKIEPPTGERARDALPLKDGESLYFSTHNRGKRSVAVDLNAPGGRELFRRLCRVSDVLLTNYRTDVPTRHGWSYKDLKADVPGLVYVHITGFGPEGAGRNRGAYDGIIQVMSGVVHMTGMPEGPPMLTGAFVADHIAAYQAAIAVLLALQQRQRTGEGAEIYVSMLDTYFATLAHSVGEAYDGLEVGRTGNRVVTAFSDMYRTTNGAIFIAPLGESVWQRFLTCVGLDESVGPVSYADAVGSRREELVAAFGQWAQNRSTEEALGVLDRAGVPCGPVRSVTEAVEAAKDGDGTMLAHVRSPRGQDMVTPGPSVRFGLSNGPRARVVPRLGEDSAWAVAIAEFDEEEAALLFESGAVMGPSSQER